MNALPMDGRVEREALHWPHGRLQHEHEGARTTRIILRGHDIVECRIQKRLPIVPRSLRQVAYEGVDGAIALPSTAVMVVGPQQTHAIPQTLSAGADAVVTPGEPLVTSNLAA